MTEDKAKTSKKVSTVGKWFRRLFLLLLFLGAALLLAPWGISKFGKGIIEREVGKHLNGTVAVEEVDLSWWSPPILTGVSITPDGGSEPAITLKSLRADKSLLDLARSDGVDTTVELEGLRIKASTRNGELDLAKLVKSSDEPAKDLPDLDIGVSVRDVELLYAHEDRPPLGIKLDSITSRFKTGQTLPVHVVAPNLTLASEVDIMTGKRIREVKDMTGHATLTFDRFELGVWQEQLQEFAQGVAGLIDGEQELSWDGRELKANGGLKLDGLKAVLTDGRGQYALKSARIDSNLVLNRDDGPTGSATVAFQELQLPQYAQLSRGPVLTGSVVAQGDADQTVSWELKDVTFDGSRVTGKGVSDFWDNFKTRADLNVRSGLASISDLVPALPTMSGQLNADVHVDWSLGGSTTLKGKTAITNLVARNLPGGAPDINEPQVELVHDVTLGEGLIEARATRLVASFANASVDGALNYGVEGQAPTGAMTFNGSGRLGRISDLLGGLMPFRMDGDIQAQGRAEGRKDGISVNADVTGSGVRLSGEKLTQGPVQVGSLRVKGEGVIGENGRSLKFPNMSIASEAMSGSGAVDVQLTESGPRGTVGFDLVGNLNSLLAMVNGLPRMQGAFKSKGSLVMGEGGSLTVNGTTEVRNLVAESLTPGAPPIREPMVALDHDFDFGGGNLVMRKAQFTSGFLRGNAQGSIRTDSKGSQEGRVEFNAQGDLARLSGLLGNKLPVQLSGNASSNGVLEGTGKGYKFQLTANGQNVVLSGGSLGPQPFSMGKVDVAATGSMSSDYKMLTVTSGQLNSPVVQGTLTGSLNSAVTPTQGEWHVDFSGEVGRLLALSPEPLPVSISGQSTVKSTVKLGTPLEFNGTLNGRNMSFRGEAIGPTPWNVTTLNADFQGVYAPVQGRLRLDRLKVGSDPLQLELRAPLVVSGLPEGQSLQATGNVKGAANLQRIPVHLLRVPADASMGGIASFEGTFTYAPGTTRTNLFASIANFQMLRPQAGSVFGSPTLKIQAGEDGAFVATLNGQSLSMTSGPGGAKVPTPIKVDARGRQNAQAKSIEVTSLTVTGSGIRQAQGSGRYAPNGASLKLNANLDMAALSNSWLKILDSGIQASGPGSLNVDLNLPAEGQQRFRRGTGNWSATLQQAKVKVLNLRNLQLQGDLRDGVATIRRGTAQLNGGTVAVTGTADFRNARPVWQGAMQANNVALREELRPAIARIIPILAGLGVQAEGTLKGNFNLRGAGRQVQGEMSFWDPNTLTGGGTLGLTKGSLRSGPILQALTQIVGIPPRLDFNGFDANFQVKNGKVFQQAEISTLQDLDLRINGTTALTGELDYVLGVRFRGQRNAKWQRYVNVLSKDGFLPLSIKGTVDKPGVPMPDPSKLLQGAAENLLGRGLNELFGGGKKKQ